MYKLSRTVQLISWCFQLKSGSPCCPIFQESIFVDVLEFGLFSFFAFNPFLGYQSHQLLFQLFTNKYRTKATTASHDCSKRNRSTNTQTDMTYTKSQAHIASHACTQWCTKFCTQSSLNLVKCAPSQTCMQSNPYPVVSVTPPTPVTNEAHTPYSALPVLSPACPHPPSQRFAGDVLLVQ